MRLLGLRFMQTNTACAGCFLFFIRPEINGKSKLLFKPPATAKSAAIRSLPRGGGPGRGHSPSCGNLSQQLNRPNTSLAACCPLSSSLPQGERTGRLLGLRFAARKTGCAGCFLFFRRPEINGCKSNLFFKPPATAKPAATCSLPCGGGPGRGHSPNGGNLS